MNEGPHTDFQPRHPMRLVTRRTGLSAARLRMWERRHGVVTPARSAGGQRLYSDDDIARLSLMARATDTGHALEQIAKLSREDLEALVGRDRPAPTAATEPFDPAVHDQLMNCVERLDGAGLERALRRAALSSGPTGFAERVLGPLLHSIGGRWHAGTLSPAHEHLASTVVRAILSWITSHLAPNGAAPVLLVATPQGERHELGAAIVAAAATEHGWRVVYLGADLPAAAIAAAVAQVRARAVALSVVNAAEAGSLGAEVTRLAEQLGGRVPLAIGGAAAPLIPSVHRTGTVVCAGLSDLRSFLDAAAAASRRI